MKVIKNLFSRVQSGDTMIEVLAAIAIIGVALAGGYALSSHSLRTGVDASQRSTALSLAQGQVEFLKNAVYTGTADTYADAEQPFCIDDSNGEVLPASTCSTHYSPYIVNITYDSTTRVFIIKPSWVGLSSGDANELSLYYKYPEGFTPMIQPPPPPPPPPGPPPVPPTASTSNPSGIASTSVTFNSQVNPNGFSTTYYFQYSRCTASTDPGPGGGQRTDGCRPPTGGSWTNTASQPAGSGTISEARSQLINGLQPHTAYLYRVIAVNAGGTVTNTGPLTPAQLNSFPPMVPCGPNMCAQGTESFWTPQ
jgi:prepilin-type N-terminal cleavage/methylation domain-containing protein